MDHWHILMVNRDPALLDFVRVLLADARYNVTTTNAVPLTFALIAAAQPALIIIDLAVTETSGWDLLVRLHAEAATAAIPVIITATDPRLLAHADRYPYLYGGRVHSAVPFAVATLLAAVRALVGDAAVTSGEAAP
jgi:two-component system OmpR family response regulator